MSFENLKISAEEINSLNVKSAADSYNNNSPRENKNIFDRLPEHIVEKHNSLVEWLTEHGQPVQSGDMMQLRVGTSGDLQISVDGEVWLNVADKALEGKADKDNSYTKDQLYTKEETDTKLNKKAEADKVYTKEETDKAIGDKMTAIGAGDMQKAVYDTDGDGMVDKAKEAENGQMWYTHSKEGTVHSLIGKGENVKFVATADWNVGDSLKINDVDAYCFNALGERLEGDELFKINCTVTCVTDGVNTFFKQGGAGLNFKIVGGTTQPASPKENTIWVNTDLEITGWAFDNTAPEYLTTGGVWFRTSGASITSFNALKKNTIKVYPVSCYQWNGNTYVRKTCLIFTNNKWNELGLILYENGVLYNNQNFVAYGTGGSASVTHGANSIRVTLGSNANAYCRLDQPVDVTNYSTVIMRFKSNGDYIETGTADHNIGASLYVGTKPSNQQWSEPHNTLKHFSAGYTYELSVDLSAMTGNRYITPMFKHGGSGTFDINILSIEVK